MRGRAGAVARAAAQTPGVLVTVLRGIGWMGEARLALQMSRSVRVKIKLLHGQHAEVSLI